MTFTESRFFDKHFRSGRYYSLRVKDPLPRVREFLAENSIEAGEYSETDLASCSSALRPADCGRQLIGLLDRLAISRGKTGWVEKTPDHLFRIPLISRICPSARFIHIIREPKANIASLYKAGRQWGKARSWLTVALKWCYAAAISMACSKDRSRHYAVFYDDILDKPGQEVGNLYEWLGLEWRDEILNDYAKVADRIKTPAEVWKSNNSMPLKASEMVCEEEVGVPGWIMRILERRYDRLRGVWKR
jgi:hypothetical protein